MDCKHRIKENDWNNIIREKKIGSIDENITFKIIDYKSLVLNVTNPNFKNELENLTSMYRERTISYNQYFIDTIMNNFDNSYYIFLFENEKIIGMTRAGVRSKKVEISMVFLLKKYRSKGYAFQMLNNFIEFLKIQEDVLKIGLSVLKSNLSAYNLYKKINFQVECENYEDIFKEILIYMYLDNF